MGRLSFCAVSFCALLFASTARADDRVEASVYAAAKRPLQAMSSLGSDLNRNIVGGAVEWAHGPAVDQSGWLLRVGGALEHQADCGRSRDCPFPLGGGSRTVENVEGNRSLSPNHGEVGAHARVGWLWTHLQLEAGALVYTQSFGSSRSTTRRDVSVVPDVVLRGGVRRTFLALGYGSYAATTIVAPGPYVQTALAFAERWQAALTGGYHDVVGYYTWRVDLGLSYRVTKNLRIGDGFGLTWAGSNRSRKVGGDLRVDVAWLF